MGDGEYSRWYERMPADRRLRAQRVFEARELDWLGRRLSRIGPGDWREREARYLKLRIELFEEKHGKGSYAGA